MKYEAYLISPEWRQKRALALQWADDRCQVCNSPHDLQVHHRTYERVGNEDLADLTVLCLECHDLFHMGGRILGLAAEEEGLVV